MSKSRTTQAQKAALAKAQALEAAAKSPEAEETEAQVEETVAEQVAEEAKEETVAEPEVEATTQEEPAPEPEALEEVPVQEPEPAEPKEEPVVEEPAPVEPEAPVVQTPQRRNSNKKKGLVRANVNANVQTVPVFSLEGIVKHKHGYDLEKADGQLKEVIDFVNSYEERMNPNINIDEKVGESLQKQLFKNYLKALSLPAQERGVALEVILWKFFENNNQVWRVNNLSRYTRNGKWNIFELQMFVQLSNLFNHIKDPAERIARVRTIKLGATVSIFPSEKAKYTEALLAWASALK